MSNERLIAFRILLDFELKKERLDVLERRYLSGQLLDARQKSHLRNLYAGVVRWQARLDGQIKQLYHGNFKKMQSKIRVVLRMGLYELEYMKVAPHGAVNSYVKLARKILNPRSASLTNAVLRNYLRKYENLKPGLNKELAQKMAEEHSMPLWLVKRWLALWDVEFTNGLCEALNRLPDFDVRINKARISTREFKNNLAALDVDFKETSADTGVLTVHKIQRLVEAGYFDKGYCSIQDRSAMLPVRFLELTKGETFLDACSAPGGKLCQALEEQPQLKMAVGLENDPLRAKKIKQNLQRLGLKAHTVVGDARHLPFKVPFDAILCDAPCSGLGVIRKHPDIKWRRTIQEIKSFSRLQRDILRGLSPALKKGGRMVYSTCTIDPLENEEVVNGFVKTRAGFRLEAPKNELKNYQSSNGFLRTFPHLHESDGSFAALLRRR